MKRTGIILIALVILALAAIYIIVPQNIHIQSNINVGCSTNGATRVLTDSSKWKNIWPGKFINSNTFEYNNISYQIHIKTNNGFVITATVNDDTINSTMFIIPFNKDSTTIYIQTALNSGSNPIARLKNYFSANDYASNSRAILLQIKNYLEQTENIYNVHIEKGRVKDTLLMKMQEKLSQQPTTKDIYDLVYKLKKAITAGGATETNYPMLNITYNDSGYYLVGVGIPVNKPVQEENGIIIRRMVPGNILITNDIKGGPATINAAFNQLQTYVADYQKIVPAIPFQSLITDRMLETDTSKWITKIYYPVEY